MSKQTLLYSLLSVGIIAMIAVGLWLWQDRTTTDSTTPAVDRPLSSYVQGSQTSAGASLRVEEPSLPSTTNNPSNQSQLPEPSEFTVYEQYAGNDTALFVDIIEGQGEAVQQNDTVAVLYKGWLTNGQLFDQTKMNEQGQLEPFIFQLGQRRVIDGWEQGIIGMKIGGTRRLIIPPSAGYGASGQGQIPPNALLIFDVELLDREPQQSP